MVVKVAGKTSIPARIYKKRIESVAIIPSSNLVRVDHDRRNVIRLTPIIRFTQLISSNLQIANLPQILAFFVISIVHASFDYGRRFSKFLSCYQLRLIFFDQIFLILDRSKTWSSPSLLLG